MKRIVCTLAVMALALASHAQEIPSDPYSKTLASTMVLTADAERLRVQAQIDQLNHVAPSAPGPQPPMLSGEPREAPSPRVTGSYGQAGERYYSVALPDGATDIARHAGQTLKGGDWRVATFGATGPTFTKTSKAQVNGKH